MQLAGGFWADYGLCGSNPAFRKTFSTECEILHSPEVGFGRSPLISSKPVSGPPEKALTGSWIPSLIADEPWSKACDLCNEGASLTHWFQALAPL
jgi:hypothetical protein